MTINSLCKTIFSLKKKNEKKEEIAVFTVFFLLHFKRQKKKEKKVLKEIFKKKKTFRSITYFNVKTIIYCCQLCVHHIFFLFFKSTKISDKLSVGLFI